jgi:hypothetical protein
VGHEKQTNDGNRFNGLALRNVNLVITENTSKIIIKKVHQNGGLFL